PPGPPTPNPPPDAKPGCEPHLRELGRLAGPSLPRNDHHRMPADGSHDVFPTRRYGKFWRILDGRHPEPSAFEEGGGISCPGEKAIQDGIVSRGGITSPQQGRRARGNA